VGRCPPSLRAPRRRRRPRRLHARHQGIGQVPGRAFPLGVQQAVPQGHDDLRRQQPARQPRAAKIYSDARVRLHEGTGVLAVQAPNLHGALPAAKAAGYSHVNIDGTLIETGRVAAPGPAGQWPCGGRESTTPTAAACRSSPSIPGASVRSSPQRWYSCTTTTPVRHDDTQCAALACPLGDTDCRLSSRARQDV
jgi:hypothetical protein